MNTYLKKIVLRSATHNNVSIRQYTYSYTFLINNKNSLKSTLGNANTSNLLKVESLCTVIIELFVVVSFFFTNTWVLLYLFYAML